MCLTTKSIHLELVMDLSTESFIAVLKRFVSRRGVPATLIIDNGTNFVDARHLQASLSKKLTGKYLLSHKIAWTHSPAISPHFGGIWEAGVKQMKALLYKHNALPARSSTRSSLRLRLL